MQKFKQHNEGAHLSLTKDDYLIMRETPRFASGRLRHIRRRIEPTGYAEESIHESGDGATGWFWHWYDKISDEQLAAVGSALAQALATADAKHEPDDPNSSYRQIEFWANGIPARIFMQDIAGAAAFESLEFENAWNLVASIFPGFSD
ncbi:MAG: hypothetical protein R3B84_21850 [Zavarzinella sp.]